MAKIGDLEVERGKIADYAVNSFFSPSGSSITMDNQSGGPNLIFVVNDSGNVSLTRTSDSAVLYSDSGYLRVMVVDEDPGSSETYTVSGGTITGGVVRLK
jgi:hypothetical protein